jgi:hypothetical protein
MKNTIFPNAEYFQIPRALYIGAWKVWFKRFGEHDKWRAGSMPLVHSDAKLFELVEQKQRFSVQVLNRLLVPWSFRNSEMVTDAFFLMNQDMLKLIEREGAEPSARLTDQALDFWDGLTFLEQDLFTSYAEARIQADIETPSNEPIVLDDAGVEVIGEDIYPPYVPSKTASAKEFANAMVAWIEEDPFTPMYQRHPAGEAVSSWHDRLEAFFWPKPRNGLMQVSHSADALMYRAEILARAIEQDIQWSVEDKKLAVKTAEEIFLQAGVPQRGVTWENVYKVMQAAISGDKTSTAKMNSGWSLLASFVTHWLKQDSNRIAMVCWNSRVSTSIISRLDFLLVEAGFTEVPEMFQSLGTVPGFGGTRPREFSLSWPQGYRSWQTQVCASEFVN